MKTNEEFGLSKISEYEPSRNIMDFHLAGFAYL